VITLINAKASRIPLATGSVNCVVTSPPYWALRDYGVSGQIGLESSPDIYIYHLMQVFQEIWRVLRNDGTLWLNLGDTYTSQPSWGRGDHTSTLDGRKHSEVPNARKDQLGRHSRQAIHGQRPKNLVGIPWRVAFALQGDGWNLRSDIIWHKPNPMPESVTDRPTKAHEYLFLLSKQARYYYDAEAVKEDSQGWNGSSFTDERDRLTKPGLGTAERVERPGRNRRSVWTIATEPTPYAHFATFPQALVEPCIKAGCPAGGMVLDPFGGSGTTALVARKLGRNAISLDLSFPYLGIAKERLGFAALDRWTNGIYTGSPNEYHDLPLFAGEG
jgi:DNA modification methylase